jgi:hypothetical protein
MHIRAMPSRGLRTVNVMSRPDADPTAGGLPWEALDEQVWFELHGTVSPVIQAARRQRRAEREQRRLAAMTEEDRARVLARKVEAERARVTRKKDQVPQAPAQP